MRIRAEPVASRLLTEVVHLRFGDPALEVRVRVHARRGVPLVVDLVAGGAVVLAAEEVVEPDLVERRRRRVRGEMPTDTVASLVRPGDHGRGVPANDAADAPLHLLVTGKPRLLVGRNRVDVRRRDERWHRHLQAARALEELADDKARPNRALGSDQRIKGLQPLGGLRGVRVGKLVKEGVEGHSKRGYTPGSRKPPALPIAVFAPTCGTVLASARVSASHASW